MEHHHGNELSMADQQVADNIEAALGGDAAARYQPSYTHMTFYWGKDSEILFSGWPGSSAGMYALATALVVLMAGLVECLGRRGTKHTARAAAAHTLRVALAYIVMLAVMSFNVGILVAAITGHTLGYIWFANPPAASGSGDREEQPAGPPGMAC